MGISLGELAARFGCELIGDPSTTVSRVATLSGADDASISFLANSSYREQLRATGAAAVIVRADDADACPAASLIAGDPYLIYARVAAVLHPRPGFAPGIHVAAVVDESATIAATACVSAGVVIGVDCVIAENVYVGPGVVVGPRCDIGRDTCLHPNVTLVQDVRIGARGIVHPGAVLGSDGFGNAMSDEGWVKVPQVGGIRIGDDVEIGANTTVDRGAIEDTVIENGVRLDNLVQIAHNVRIGEHTAMAAFTGISGSTRIGKRCTFAGRVGVVGHITICDDVVVGGAAVVSKDITSPGFYSGSFPAEKDRDWKRRVARFRRLEQLEKRVSGLEGSAGKNGE